MNFLHGTNLQYYYLEVTIREYMAVVMVPLHKQRMERLETITGKQSITLKNSCQI